MAKREQPVAVCTKCSSVSRRMEQINQRCSEKISGKPCEGVYESMLRPDDWKECHRCGATGRTDTERCIACNGEGWICVRVRGRV